MRAMRESLLAAPSAQSFVKGGFADFEPDRRLAHCQSFADDLAGPLELLGRNDRLAPALPASGRRRG